MPYIRNNSTTSELVVLVSLRGRLWKLFKRQTAISRQTFWCISTVRWLTQQSCKSEITQFQLTSFCNQNIFRFHISMDTLQTNHEMRRNKMYDVCSFKECKWRRDRIKITIGQIPSFSLLICQWINTYFVNTKLKLIPETHLWMVSHRNFLWKVFNRLTFVNRIHDWTGKYWVHIRDERYPMDYRSCDCEMILFF